MTTEEKLQNFYTASIESAQNEAKALLDEHQAALDKIFQEHQEMKHRQAEAELHAEADKLKRETPLSSCCVAEVLCSVFYADTEAAEAKNGNYKKRFLKS